MHYRKAFVGPTIFLLAQMCETSLVVMEGSRFMGYLALEVEVSERNYA